MVEKKSKVIEGKNLILLWIFVFLAVILFLWLVIAVGGENVIKSPASQANFSNSSTMFLNVSFQNGTDITIGGIGNINQTTINASFYYNESGVWRFLGNSSTCAVNACWGTINLNITNVSDGVFSINATLYNETASSPVYNASNITNLIRVDKTPPISFIQNFSRPLFAEGNYSGTNIILNASIFEATTTVQTVIFNITNITGEQHNASFTGTIESGSNAFKNFFNTTAFPDGTYNISVNVNDTVNNRNNTARFTVRFDNTRPLILDANISSPGNETNYTGANNLLLNVSAIDVTSGMQTIYFNITNITGTQNATFTATRQGTTSYYNTFLNATGFRDGIYNVTVFSNDTAGNTNNTARVFSVRFDNTSPISFIQNFSRPLFAEGNYSGTNIVFNVSIFDATTAVHTVIFNITNITGEQHNASFTGTVESGSVAFKNFVNTTAFPDGTYNISVNVNDTLNNRNTTARFTVRFDNTRPLVLNENISRPLFAGGNYSSTNIRLNVSAIDLTSSMQIVYFNITNATGEQNATFNATRDGTSSSFVTYLNTTGFADGNYTITVFSNDTAGNTNNTARLIDIRFDNTRPLAFSNNISLPLSGTNHTGTKIFNVSLVDALTGIQVVYFNVTNGTGGQNATYTATREGTTSRYSVSVSTAEMKDGNYTVTAFVNDTAGNLNSSAATTSILFDNTAPAVSVSCTPNTVTAGDTITCTCTRSDSTSGINPASLSFVANPSTSSTGTFTSTCTVSDFAGNSASGSTTYRVESGGSGASKGGGGGSSSTSTETRPAEERTKRADVIKPETPATLTNFGNTNVKEIVIDVKENAVNVQITVAKYDNRPSEVTTKDGKVHSYMQIKPNNALKDKIEEVKITVKVDKTWINNNGLTTDKVEVYKFENNVWNGLGAVYKGDEGNNALYEIKVKGFSFFAIGEKAVELVEEPTETPVEEETPQLEASPTFAPEEGVSNLLIWIVVVVIIVIAIVVSFIVWKRR